MGGPDYAAKQLVSPLRPSSTGEFSWLNGEVVNTQLATVSCLDHGYTRGHGTYETLAVIRGRPFALRRHLARLRRTLEFLGISLDFNDETLSSAIEEIIALNAENADVIRLIVTSGENALELSAKPNIVVSSMRSNTDGKSSRGARVITARQCRNERAATVGLKTTSNIENVIASRFAAAEEASEVLIPNTRGEICEGSTSNIFCGISGSLLTPSLASGCLPGVTRELVLGLVSVTERTIRMEELDMVDEAFITSSLRGIEPIASIDGRWLLSPGPLTSRAQRAFRALEEKCSDP